jgi:hypothetical protein
MSYILDALRVNVMKPLLEKEDSEEENATQEEADNV